MAEAPSPGAAAVAPGVRGAPRAFYVAPTGSPAGDGSAEHPWDIAVAFGGAGGRIQPGDTVWLRGGRYVGPLTSRLRGTPDAPIIVRQLPGERATLDNRSTTQVTLRVEGEWVWYWGFEVTNSNPDRRTRRPNGIYPRQPNNKFINLVVHDNAVGVSFSTESRNSEVYGCLIFNNGYRGGDRTHGHGIYAKNDGRTPKLVRDNVVFNQFRNGIQIYTDAGTGQLRNFLVEGNVWFNNGTLTSTGSTAANILVGGREVADQIVLRRNMTYFSPGVAARNVRIGYGGTLRNGSVTVRDNYFVGGRLVLDLGAWDQATVVDNVLAGPAALLALTAPPPGSAEWHGNRYWRDPADAAWYAADSGHALAAWQRVTDLGESDQAVAGVPREARVFVRPNAYEAGRANIVVYNWGRAARVDVDVSGVLAVGDRYAVMNVQDFYGAPVAQGTYAGGTLALPMAGVAPPRPVGTTPGAAPRTGPAFDVFILTRVP
jgi:hypothetical protein